MNFDNQYTFRLGPVLLGLLFLISSAAGVVLAAVDRTRPNIILIMVDDMGYSDIGCYGGEVQTPNIDMLAQGGLRFTQFYNTAKCHTTRAELLTGNYAYAIGDKNLEYGATFGEVLRGVGYRTLIAGKWHQRPLPTTRGFDRYYGLADGCCNFFNPGLEAREGEGPPGRKGQNRVRRWAIEDKVIMGYTNPDKDFYTTDAFTTYAIERLDEYKDEDKPFLLYLPYTAPHYPLHAWPEDISKYRGRFKVGWDVIRQQRFERMQKMGIIGPHHRLTPRESTAWDELSKEQQDAEDLKMAVYCAMIDRVDQNLGRVFQKVKQLGKWDNTLIMFLTDNGACREQPNTTPNIPPGPVESYRTISVGWANASNTPYRKFKSTDYEGGTRTPFIAYWPGVIQAGITEQVGHIIDITPTFMAITGAEYPERINGRTTRPPAGKSLLPVFHGKERTPHQELYWRFGQAKAVRQGDLKAVRLGNAPWELYDLSTDPTEMTDLAGSRPEKLDELVALWETWNEDLAPEVYLDAAGRFADCVLSNGRDTYGKEHTPLFVDGLQVETLEPAVWKKDGETWVLCNFASQQPLMRLLDGLTAVTGRAKYRVAAEDAARHVMRHLQTPNGLLHWGGHMAWDLAGEQPVGQYDLVHELKGHQPYYALLFRVAPSATRRLQETIWATHVLDWSLLDYNRHASGAKDRRPQWDHTFETDIEVPFPARGSNLSFVNVTPPLLHTGVMLAIQNDNADALRWSQHLVVRWQQARDASTGLSGGQLSYREHDRARDALGHVHATINEAKIVASYHQTSRYHTLPLAQLQAGEQLLSAGDAFAQVGRAFIAGAAEDLKIYARECFDKETGQFIAMTTAGESLRWREAKTDYYTPSSFKPCRADPFLFWGYCTAFRLTGDPALWTMVRRIAEQFELGDLGPSPQGSRDVSGTTNADDWRIVYALLELYESTDDAAILRLAARVGDNLVKQQHASGLFPSSNRNYARTGDEAPLALLHLAAAIQGRRSELPPAKFDRRFFHAEFHGPLEAHQQKRADARTYDNYVYFGQ